MNQIPFPGRLGLAVLLPIALLAESGNAQTTRVTDVEGVQWYADFAASKQSTDGLTLTYGGSKTELPFDRLRSIRTDADLLAPAPIRIYLRNGDLVQTNTAVGSENGLRANLDESTFGLDVSLELATQRLRAVVFDTTVENPGLNDALANPPRTDDLLFAVDNEGKVRSLTVRVERFENEIVHLDFDGTAQQLPFERCVAVCFGSERGLRRSDPARPFVRVKTIDGSILTGKLHGDRAPDLGFRTSNRDLHLPVGAIVSIDSWSSQVQSIANLEPIAVEQVPAFDRIRPWLRGRTPSSEGFRLLRRNWSEGFCLVPRTSLRFDLRAAIGEGRFDTLRTTVGIDERSSGPAHAVFRIRLDDEVVFERTMSRDDEAVRVSIPLVRDGAMPSTLTFETDFGKTLDLGDHCVFASPRLVRES